MKEKEKIVNNLNDQNKKLNNEMWLLKRKEAESHKVAPQDEPTLDAPENQSEAEILENMKTGTVQESEQNSTETKQTPRFFH